MGIICPLVEICRYWSDKIQIHFVMLLCIKIDPFVIFMSVSTYLHNNVPFLSFGFQKTILFCIVTITIDPFVIFYALSFYKFQNVLCQSKFLSQPKNLPAFSASSKTFVPAQKPILLNANHLFVWHKKFGPAQNILEPVKGPGISLKSNLSY